MTLERTQDGVTFATAPSGLSEILLNGRSVIGYQPVELRMGPDGWGYVVCLIDPITNVTKRQIDGMRRTYTRWGWLTIS